MADQVVIEMVTDASKLEPALEILKRLGKVSDDDYKAMKKLSEESNKSFEHLKKSAAAALPTLDKVEDAIVSLANTTHEALSKDVVEAFIEAGKSSKKLADEVDKTEEKAKKFKTRLMELKSALQQMEEAGQAGTREFHLMATEAAALEDQIGDTAQRIRALSSDTANLDAGIEALQGLAGGFQFVTAAQELFGMGSEDVQKAIAKLNAIMAISQSLQQAQDFIRGQSILKLKLQSAAQAVLNFIMTGSFTATSQASAATVTNTVATEAQTVATVATTTATTGATVAMRALRVAILLSGIGAIVVLLGAAAYAMGLFSEKTETAAESQEKLAAATRLAVDAANQQVDALDDIEQLNIKRAKAAGATESQIAAMEKGAIQKRIDNRNKIIDQFIKEGKSIHDLSEQNSADIKLLNHAEVDGQIEKNQKLREESKKASDLRKELAKKDADALAEIEKRKLEILSADMKRVAEAETLPFEVRNNAAAKYIELQTIIAANARKAVQDAAKDPANKITGGELELAKLAENEALAKLAEEGATMRYNIEKDGRGKVVELFKAPDIPEVTKEQANELLKITDERLKEEVKKIDDAEKKKLELLKASISATANFVDSALGGSSAGNVLKNALSLYQQLEEADAAFKEGSITREEQYQQKKAAIITTATASVQEAVDGFYAASAAKRQAELDEAITRLQTQKQRELDVENQTQQQKDDTNKKYAAKERALRLKAFEEDKRAKRAAAIINGLLAVTNALATAPTIIAGIALAALAVATTAIQVNRINQTLPGFKKGTRNAPRGFAWVGEEGPELVHLKGGEKIWTYNQSRKVSEAWEGGSVYNPDQILNGYEMPAAIPEDVLSYNSVQNVQINYDELGKAVARNMPKIPAPVQNIINMDENGFTKSIVDGITRTEIRNKRYKF